MEETPKRRGRKPKVDESTNTSKSEGSKKRTYLRVQSAIKNLQSKHYFDATGNQATQDGGNGPNMISLILHLPVKSSDIEDGVPIFNSEKFFGKLAQRNGNGNTIPEPSINDTEEEIYIEPVHKKKANPFLSPYGVKDDGKYTFIEQSNWIKSTSTCCWWCCHKFENVPCGIPDNYDEPNGVFYLYGCFCSFNCCLAYIIQYLEDKKWEKASLLHLFYKKIYHRDDTIHPALRKELLNCFGGPLNIDEFREASLTLNLMNVVLPPINAIRPKLEQRDFIRSISRVSSSLPNGGSLDSLLDFPSGTDIKFPSQEEGNLSSLLSDVYGTGATPKYRIQRNKPIKEHNERFIRNFLRKDKSNMLEENSQPSHQQ